MSLTRAQLFIIHTESNICFCILGALYITTLDSLRRHVSVYWLYKVIYKASYINYFYLQKKCRFKLMFWVIIAG